MLKDLWGLKHVKWKAVNAKGSAGDILLLWDDRFISVSDSRIGEFSVSVIVEDLARNHKWMATSVYGPSNNQRREDLYNELNDIRGRWNGAWCAGGDWNVIRFPSERLGENLITLDMKRFSDFTHSW